MLLSTGIPSSVTPLFFLVVLSSAASASSSDPAHTSRFTSISSSSTSSSSTSSLSTSSSTSSSLTHSTTSSLSSALANLKIAGSSTLSSQSTSSVSSTLANLKISGSPTTLSHSITPLPSPPDNATDSFTYDRGQSTIYGPSSAYYFDNNWDWVNPYYFALLNLGKTADPAALSSVNRCSRLWVTFSSHWKETAPATWGPEIPATTETRPIAPWVSSAPGSTETLPDGSLSIHPGITSVIPPTTSTITHGQQGPLYYVDRQVPWTASEPCCGHCGLKGGTVEVFVWPTVTESTPVSTLVNSVGFTFTSPSTYVAFESIYAKNMCGFVGNKYSRITLAFNPGELSTSRGWRINQGTQTNANWLLPVDWKAAGWTKATFGDQTDCVDKYQGIWHLGKMQFVHHDSALAAASSLLIEYPNAGTTAEDLLTATQLTYNLCSPTLSVPSQILAMDARWSSCSPPVTALFDPPYTLQPAKGLTALDPITKPPSPAPTPEPELASETTATKESPTLIPRPSSVAGDPKPTPVIGDPKPSSVAEDPAIDPSPPKPTTEIQTVQIVTVSPSVSSIPIKSQISSSRLVPVISFGSSVITADPASNLVFSSKTLSRGGEVIISGTHISLASDGSFVVIDGKTQTLATATIVVDPPTPTDFEIVVSSQTLRPGGAAITVDGTVISLLPGATDVVIGTKTLVLTEVFPGATSSEVNIGGIIATIGGFGEDHPVPTVVGPGGGSDGYNGTVFLGDAGRTTCQKNPWSIALSLGIGILNNWLLLM